MGVFSYLNLKRPANFIWKTFSPGRDLGDEKGDGGSQRTLNSSGGDISLASGASGSAEPATEFVTLKDTEKDDRRKSWFGRQGSDTKDWLVQREDGGQERLVGGREGALNFVTCLPPGQHPAYVIHAESSWGRHILILHILTKPLCGAN